VAEGARPLSPGLPAPVRAVLLLAGALWTLPNTLIGAVAGAAGIALGARPAISHGALVFFRFPWGPGGALTLGQVVLCTGDSLEVPCLTYARRAGHDHAAQDESVLLGLHEQAHVLQYLALGPLFLPLYFACGGIHERNRFERAADRYAATGRGWWPWAA
jgi:hypothetical protein